MSGVLIYLLCQIADPAACEEHSMRTFGGRACLSIAQAELAAVARPGWRVARWRCEYARPLDRAATSGDGPAGVAPRRSASNTRPGALPTAD